MEIIIMIVLRCTGPTIIRFRQVNRYFHRFVDDNAATRLPTFGRLPAKVMLRILEYVTRPYIESNPLITANDDDVYAWLAVFDRVNTTYNALTHNHIWITPYLFRGGRVYNSLAESGWRWQAVQTHPIFFALNISYVSHLGTLGIRSYHPTSESALSKCPARHEFATNPPYKQLWMRHESKPIKDDSGVRVIDVLRRCCDDENTPEPRSIRDVSDLSVEVWDEKDGFPVLWLSEI